MNRRDFLDLRQLASGEPAPPSRADFALVRFRRQAMATQFEIAFPFGTPHAAEMAHDALDLIDRLEAQLTVYNEHSEISRLNRLAARHPVVVEERLFGLLALSQRLQTQTSGAFDITTGALVKCWGFFRRQGRVPTEEERADVRQRVGMNHVELDAARRSVSFRRPGLEINLGSIGKGYALDRVAETLRTKWNLSSALLHGGHSSVYAIGNEPGGERGWLVGIRHPWQPERRLASIWLRDAGLATSAATFQHLEYNGRKLGHILDPRTGWPAEGLASVSVVAPTAAEADALATAFFILGLEAARAYVAAHPGIGVILLPTAEASRPVILGFAPATVTLEPSPKGTDSLYSP
ncbi:MAG: FAD:protein FMN transferase [Gemmataceae bacterium]